MQKDRGGYREKKAEGLSDTWKEIFPNGGEAAYRAKEAADEAKAARAKETARKQRSFDYHSGNNVKGR